MLTVPLQRFKFSRFIERQLCIKAVFKEFAKSGVVISQVLSYSVTTLNSIHTKVWILHWSGQKVRKTVFTWSEIHLYWSNFLQNPYFSWKFKFSRYYSIKLPKFLQEIIICFLNFQNFII